MFLMKLGYTRITVQLFTFVSGPPNFSFISETRIHTKGGGVRVLFKELLRCKQMLMMKIVLNSNMWLFS